MSKSTVNNSIAEKLAQLNTQIAWFESEEFVVEEAAERFRAAQQLAEEIEHDLLTLKNEVVVLKKQFDEA